MATIAERRRVVTRWPSLRRDPAHILLIAVSAGYCLLVLLRTPQTVPLTFDEVVYASQLSVDTPAAEFADHRARGLPLLLAPVVMVTESVLALRLYLTLASGVLMYLAFRPWLAVFGRAAEARYRYVPAVAAGCFATLWAALFFATLAYPNLWLGFMIVAGVGYLSRAVTEPPPAAGAVVGVLVAFALASLIRPSDALAAAGPALVAVLLVRQWRRPWPPLAVVAGLSVGWGAWFGEGVARFGGPVERLRAGAESTGTGLVNAVPANLHAVDGLSLLCRPPSDCAERLDPLAVAWWVLLPVLVAAGLVVAVRKGWFGAGALATVSAVGFAAPYLLLLDYTAPRFLLAGYALLAIPVAGLLVWLTGLGDDRARAVATAAVAGAVLVHGAAQQQVLETVGGRMENTYGRYTRLAEFLREEQGVRPPCLVWGAGAIPLSYHLKCRSEWEPGGDAPAADDPVIAAALARGDTVLVRIRADDDPPSSMADWERLDLPGSAKYTGYLLPEGH